MLLPDIIKVGELHDDMQVVRPNEIDFSGPEDKILSLADALAFYQSGRQGKRDWFLIMSFYVTGGIGMHEREPTVGHDW